jgi:hypothetical protein
VLNESAPFFFVVVHDVLFDHTLLAIAGLVGPPQSVGKPNLAVERFPPLLSDDPDLQANVRELVEKAKNFAAFAIDWRHRRLAHHDLSLALQNPTVQPLATVTRGQIEQALSALGNVLNCIEGKYCHSDTLYSARSAPGDAKHLLHIVQSGLFRERDKLERWKRGEFRDDDEPPADI